MDKIKTNWTLLPAIIIFCGLAYKVFEQSVLEHHFIIPSTQWLPPALIAGNLIYYALKGKLWARLVHFWICVCFWFMGFFSLFYSPTLEKTYLGPVWAGLFVGVAVIAGAYFLYCHQKALGLFKD
ncbi:MAG: hypothetical protein P8H03_07065 [Emcibacteraceae bacterium]|nr:hypothetical protein [Emcibacteraceae bacterium]